MQKNKNNQKHNAAPAPSAPVVEKVEDVVAQVAVEPATVESIELKALELDAKVSQAKVDLVLSRSALSRAKDALTIAKIKAKSMTDEAEKKTMLEEKEQAVADWEGSVQFASSHLDAVKAMKADFASTVAEAKKKAREDAKALKDAKKNGKKAMAELQEKVRQLSYTFVDCEELERLFPSDHASHFPSMSKFKDEVDTLLGELNKLLPADESEEKAAE